MGHTLHLPNSAIPQHMAPCYSPQLPSYHTLSHPSRLPKHFLQRPNSIRTRRYNPTHLYRILDTIPMVGHFPRGPLDLVLKYTNSITTVRSHQALVDAACLGAEAFACWLERDWSGVAGRGQVGHAVADVVLVVNWLPKGIYVDYVIDTGERAAFTVPL